MLKIPNPSLCNNQTILHTIKHTFLHLILDRYWRIMHTFSFLNFKILSSTNTTTCGTYDSPTLCQVDFSMLNYLMRCEMENLYYRSEFHLIDVLKSTTKFLLSDLLIYSSYDCSQFNLHWFGLIFQQIWALKSAIYHESRGCKVERD